MNRTALAFLAALVIAGIVWFAMGPTRNRGSRVSPAETPTATARYAEFPENVAAHSTPAPGGEVPRSLADAQPLPIPSAPGQAAPALPTPAPGTPAPRTVEAELNMVRTVVRDYRAAFGSNPVGSNREITAALSGKNPRQASFLPDDALRNEKGELLDRWSRPYFFHQISGSLMEVRSAGPDGRMWTDDDLSVR